MDANECRALIDRLQAENAETLKDMAERKARRLAGEESREWQRPEPEPPKPTPKPQEQATTMTPEHQAGWDKWCDSRIRLLLDKRTDRLIDATVEFVCERMKKARAEISAEIGELRAEHAVELQALREEIRSLKDGHAEQRNPWGPRRKATAARRHGHAGTH